MFPHLKSIVDLIRSGVADYREFKTDHERKGTVLQLLKTYFLLKDCVDEGEALISDAGLDPVGKIEAMEASEAHSTLEWWSAVLANQRVRLFELDSY